MGVSGNGKSTIGQQLSAKTGFPFYDADNFHSKENIAGMNTGLPLTDNARLSWLERLHQFVSGQIETGNIIIACSALKKNTGIYAINRLRITLTRFSETEILK